MKLFFPIFLTGYLLLTGLALQAQPEKPRLIIGIVVEQMRYDYLERYWNKLEDNGFKKLINNGMYCRNTYHNYMFAQTGSGHATISTGTTPSNHGIVGTSWYDNKEEEYIYCTTDKNARTVGSPTEQGKMSPHNLLASTVGDELLLSSMNRSKVISVSMNDCSAILTAGHSATAAYWFDDRAGIMISSNHYINELPRWVKDFNFNRYPDYYLEKSWNTAFTISEYTESLPDFNLYETGFLNQYQIFPYNLNELNKETPGYTILEETPFANTVLSKFAIEAIENEQLGQDEYTDILYVNFSPMHNIGHRFGAHSVEMEDAYIRLDMDIYNLITYVEKEIGSKNVLFFLTSDHGAPLHPDYLEEEGFQAGRFNYKSGISLMRVYLSAMHGHQDWIKAYNNQQFYLDRQLAEDEKIPLNQLQDDAAQLMIQFSGVKNAITGHNLQTAHFTNRYLQRMQNAYHQKRSGDLIINLESFWLEDSDNGLTYNSPYQYDTHVPLIWYGWKIPPGTLSREVHISDIAPTLSTILHIPQPSACTGTPIQEITD